MDTISTLNPPREDGFPKIIEISGQGISTHIDAKDPNFNEPLDKLYKEYQD